MIGVVIVLYNPQPEDKAHVTAMAQHYAGVIVDNSAVASMETSDEYIGRMKYVALCENKGIAEAQNIGVRHLLEKCGTHLSEEGDGNHAEKGAIVHISEEGDGNHAEKGGGAHLSEKEVKYIVFLDQDSRCQLDYCERIVAEYERVKTREPRLALLGPSMTNSVTNEEYRPYVHPEHFDEGGFSARHYMISSGSCVETRVLDDVGLNDEALFIDFVDFEWCWRAESKGYVCGVTRNVTLNHHVGQGELKIGTYRVIVSSPQRYYYQYRNHLWLCCRSYVPLQWKITTGIKHIARLIYLPWLVNDGMRVWKNMLKGIADSFR